MPPAPAPVVAAESAGIDTMTKGFAASVAAATLNAAAAQMSKWRVRRGSDPIHNRS